MNSCLFKKPIYKPKLSASSSLPVSFPMKKVTPIGPACNETIYEPLLDTESSVMCFMSEPAVTSISFFEKAHFQNSIEGMKQRIAAICRANPWLAARLIKDKKKHQNVLLAIPQTITEEDIEVIFCTEDASLATISTKMPYSTVCKAVIKSKAMVKPGYSLIGKDVRIAKFTLVPIDHGQVAFVLSITHAVADGHTYYSIMNMMTDGNDIKSLSFTRKHEFIPKMKEAIGEEEHQLLYSPALILNFIPTMLCGPTTHFDARFVDEEKVRQIKAEAEARSGTGAEDTFACSTNDILTSTFATAANADILLMAINLRTRLKEANDNDSGNYESVALYDSSSSSTPEGIRQSLRGGPPFKRVGGSPLPGFFKLLRIRMAIITNWAFPFFKADLHLLDANCEKTSAIRLHLPVYDQANLVFPLAIIFRPYHDKLAVLYGGSTRDLSNEKLLASGAPIGNRVSNDMFTE